MSIYTSHILRLKNSCVVTIDIEERSIRVTRGTGFFGTGFIFQFPNLLGRYGSLSGLKNDVKAWLCLSVVKGGLKKFHTETSIYYLDD